MYVSIYNFWSDGFSCDSPHQFSPHLFQHSFTASPLTSFLIKQIRNLLFTCPVREWWQSSGFIHNFLWSFSSARFSLCLYLFKQVPYLFSHQIESVFHSFQNRTESDKICIARAAVWSTTTEERWYDFLNRKGESELPSTVNKIVDGERMYREVGKQGKNGFFKKRIA